MAQAAYNSVLARKVASVYVPIAQCRSIDGPSLTVDSLETTHLTSTDHARTFIPSWKDPGEINCTLLFDQNSQNHQDLLDLWDAPVVEDYQLTIVDADGVPAEFRFSAFLTQFGFGIEFEGLVEVEATFKLTGPVDFDFDEEVS